MTVKCAHLIELELIDQLEKLPVLFALLNFHVVLLQAMQGELGIVVDADFERLKETRGCVMNNVFKVRKVGFL